MDIIEQFERRDETAIELLKAHYGDYCYGIIYHQLGSREDAEEALNDVWVKIWSSIPPARPTHLRAYLAKTARNIAIDYIKRDAAQRRSGLTTLLDEISVIVPDGSGSNGILKDTLNRFLRSLKAEERRIFLRRYWYGASIEELSEELCCSQTRVANILLRTRKKLKKYLEKEGFTV